MITIIESIFGSKLGRVLAEVLAALALIAVLVLHYEHKGASQALAKLETSSAQLVVKAQAEIAKEAASHQADVKANQEKTDAALAQVATTNNALSNSVRDFDAYRRAHPDVSRPRGGLNATPGGNASTVDYGAIAVQLAEVGNELARSAGDLAASLQSCQRDRDSLTGLPR